MAKAIMAGSQSHNPEDYYDIIMVGKTGQGKSTLGNKLLNVQRPQGIETTGAQHGAKVFTQKIGSFLSYFKTADDFEESGKVDSITDECQLSINDKIKVRVLDTPGFASSDMKPGVTVYQSNLQIFRWIVREQLKPNVQMAANRLLYFLPNRGTLRKADGVLQEELKVMHYFFGSDVFDNMVIIATQDIDYQDNAYTTDKIEKTKSAFCRVVELATKLKMTPDTCPPVLYIGLNDTHEEVLRAVKQAKVLAGAAVFKPAFQDGVCSHCTAKTRYSKTEGKLVPVGVINNDDVFEKYEKSKCHPKFIPKYSKVEKFFGGLGHMATLGSALVYEVVTGEDTWPGFTNSDEICPYCKQAPGSKGCCVVLTECKIPGTDTVVIVDHTSNL